MSGGSHDYAEHKILELATSVSGRNEEYHSLRYSSLRKRLVRHLQELAEVVHAIEWADSGDWSDEDAEKALTEFFGGKDKVNDLLDAASFRLLRRIITEGSES